MKIIFLFILFFKLKVIADLTGNCNDLIGVRYRRFQIQELVWWYFGISYLQKSNASIRGYMIIIVCKSRSRLFSYHHDTRTAKMIVKYLE